MPSRRSFLLTASAALTACARRERIAGCTIDYQSTALVEALAAGGDAAGAAHPERILGMHYFSPVHRMPLLELVVTDATANWAVATATRA